MKQTDMSARLIDMLKKIFMDMHNLIRTPRFLLVFTLLLTAASASAQSTTIRGTLLDSLTRESEPFATVRVYKQADQKQAVGMSVSDADGHFAQTVKGKGQFTIVFSSVGKAALSRSVVLNGEPEINLGTLLMRDDAEMLGNVEVVAQVPLVKMETDKMSYNVSDDVDSKSSTVLDMLRKVPMVSVDGQDNITVNGSSSFKIYVDGKPNPMLSSNPGQIFKAMPASMVKSIEVVTNPGAKYDAEGTGGVLNIIMQKMGDGSSQADMNGYNGSVRAMASTRGYGGSTMVNVQQGKFSMSASLMYQHQEQKNMEVWQDRTQQTPLGESLTSTYMKGKNKNDFGRMSLSFGYDLDTLSNIGGSVSMMYAPNSNRTFGSNAMSGGFYGDGLAYDNASHTKNRYGQINASLDYQRFFNADRTRSLTLSYLFNINPQQGDNENNYSVRQTPEEQTAVPVDLSSFRSEDHAHTQEHTVQVDYATPIAKGQTLDVGAKFIARTNASNSKYFTSADDEWIYREDASMRYRHLNDIAAGYAEYAGTFGKIGTKAGLRYEHTWQRVKYLLGQGENFHTDYGNLVPSASLSYNFSPVHNIGLTYNMRISRPSISYLNPYVNKGDATSVSYGNTDLDVEKSHNIGLVVNAFTPKIMVNLNLRQSFSNNSIAQYSFYEGNILNTTYGNIVHDRTSSANLYMGLTPAKNTRIIFNGGVNYTHLGSNQLDIRNHGWSANAMFNVQQTLPWQLKLSAALMANTKSYELQGWRSGFSGCFGNLAKSFLNDKLNVSIYGFTGLRSGGKLMFKNYSHAADFTSMQTVKVPVAQCGLQLTFNFGNTKQRMKQYQSKISNDFMEDKNDSQQTGTGTMMGN